MKCVIVFLNFRIIIKQPLKTKVMAEIKIEKKKPIWPWILIILIILAAIYFFWYYNDNNYNTDKNLMEKDSITQLDESDTHDNEVIDSTTLYTGSYGTIRNEQAIADYLNFIDLNKDISRETNNEYYRSAFFKLITATKREAEIKNVDVTEDIAAAMKNAELLTNDPTVTQKTDIIRKVAENVSKALKTIQQQKFIDFSGEGNSVETASNNINASGKIEDERKNVDMFFDKSAILLQKMYQKEEENK